MKKFGVGGMLFAYAYELVSTGTTAVQADPMNITGWVQIGIGGAIGGIAYYLVNSGYIEMKLKR